MGHSDMRPVQPGGDVWDERVIFVNQRCWRNRVSVSSAQGKSFDIDKRLIWEAWKQVRQRQGAPGIDGQTIEQFEADLEGQLYKLWNRMSSGRRVVGNLLSVACEGGGDTQAGVRSDADVGCADRVRQSRPDRGGHAVG